ncbi:sensor histidine kinase [Pseudoduganella lutea]|uniref:histidine kinase n=2 Tax=Pseudoduganella lutea TaxID=321985 RepID=A0A4P6L837_9BURK|nr:sensor histidine kinase [Pseudoduganella lutea]
MTIAKFIRANSEKILAKWEVFARTLGAVTENMSSTDLRDHAKQILEFVAADIDDVRQDLHGDSQRSPAALADSKDSASYIHGRLRYASGFTQLQLIAEYRALRASVLRLWEQDSESISRDSLHDVIRFNEAIDESISEAAMAFSEKVNETRDLFLAILGHDLRSPLAATSTAGTYLSTPGVFNEQVRQIGGRVKRSAVTMSGMVDDLLALARTQLGDGIAIERETCDLLQMCEWAIEDARSAHPRALYELSAIGDLAGSFDRPRLQQLLTNLANNAAQYGSPGLPILISVSGEVERIVFMVRNQGPTIPKDALPKLFSSLVQLPEQNGDERPRSSLGLGLFIAKQIAVAHGGSIDVTSDEVNGTVFSVIIPRT